ncbi:MAG: aldo/keto reductase [Chloroflexi bacterium]|nr:aldo/keto reductase [Chloroflexota bacterium]
MNYRQLGKTGLTVSEIGFGCGNVGGLMIRGNHDEQVEAVKHALELGINYFDTAPVYGDGQSETNLGKVLDELNPKIILATKIRIGRDDLQDIKSAVQRSLETSLKRLKRDSVDILQLHTPISADQETTVTRDSIELSSVLGKCGVANAFDAVRSQGMVRFIGFTGLGDAEALHKVARSGCFDLMQVYYNLLNPSAGWKVPPYFSGYNFQQLIDIAASQGMAVAIIRVMAGGALGGTIARTGYASPRVGETIVPGGEYKADEVRSSKLGFLLSGDVDNLPQAAICFALMKPSVSTVLVGFSSREQIDKAAACSGKAPLPSIAVEQLQRLWSTNFETRPA